MNRIIMTGGTSGLGAHALHALAEAPSASILAGARSEWSPSSSQITSLPLDLSRLASVREFADAVRQHLAGLSMDALVLNAGAQFPDTTHRSEDGFELTFAINHLAHYLLARLLLSEIRDGGRLVITTSDTHDPRVFPNAPRTLDPGALAHPQTGKSNSGFNAYAASKLCNMMTALSLSQLDEVKRRGIKVIAYNPGLTLGTSLMRAAPGWMRALMSSALGRGMLKLMSRSNEAMYPGTPERAGAALADLVLGREEPPAGRIYASLVKGEMTYPDPSELARDEEARARLWRESAGMAGLPVE